MTNSIATKPVVLGHRRNLPAQERRKALLEAAIDIYAQKGLSITIQELADRVQVTQPLVHRYFPTKADLIEAISDALQNGHWDNSWQEILADSSRSLEERLTTFYAAYTPTIFGQRWYRGFIFAALANPEAARSYMLKFKTTLFVEIVRAARELHGLPTIENAAITEQEYELIWALHSTATFAGMRMYIYELPVEIPIDTIMRDQITAYVMMVGPVMKRALGLEN